MSQMTFFGDHESGAEISTDGVHRWSLWRRWNPTGKLITFVMLNPSTADHKLNDPTIRRCMNFAAEWGFGAVLVVNLFSVRATDPQDLIRMVQDEDRIRLSHELRNQSAINDACKTSDAIVCAWGNSPVLNKIWNQPLTPLEFVRTMAEGRKIYCIDQSKDGTPKHPLYLKKDLRLKEI